MVANGGTNDQPERADRPLLDVRGVAGFLRVSESFVRKKVAAGEIPYVRAGRLIRFDPVEIRQWLREQAGREGHE